jgi:lactate racemase
MMKKDILSETEIEQIVVQSLAPLPIEGQRVLVLIPDHTRTMPLPLFFRLLTRHLLPRVKALNFLVALGTHPAMSESAIQEMVGITPEERQGPYRAVGLFNHAWDDPAALVSLGMISAEEIDALSGGMLHQAVDVRLNRMVLEHDLLLVCGPVFPHEVVGFSGGNKYFFPGIAGPEIINLTHWLGALITSFHTIGQTDTPMRRVIDRAASIIPRPRYAFCAVISPSSGNETSPGASSADEADAGPQLAGLFFGSPETAFAQAARLSAQKHIIYSPQPYARVLAILPAMYIELWVGGKGMYKLEPVVADGGELIIYAPHLHEISLTHGRLIREVGYHVRDYFVKQWERFEHYPWSVLAHSTHVRGLGTYENGIEHPRIQVTLATGIPEAVCREIALGYLDPRSVDLAAWKGRADWLVVPHAGEYLFKLSEE